MPWKYQVYSLSIDSQIVMTILQLRGLHRRGRGRHWCRAGGSRACRGLCRIRLSILGFDEAILRFDEGREMSGADLPRIVALRTDHKHRLRRALAGVGIDAKGTHFTKTDNQVML